ncbi:LexA family protein [Rahnella inusitata]|uniref:LexA family protein n=1 Tax=Rahnella inusitata TaxID=58169 RepID=UPI0039BE094A
MNELTIMQANVLEIIARFIHNNGFPPTLAEIADQAGYSSPNSVAGHLDRLKKKGFITTQPYTSRGIRVLKNPDSSRTAPAILNDVLTAIQIGGSRKELIDALTAIKPKFGTPGSRDIDVRAVHVAIDKAIEKLSNL